MADEAPKPRRKRKSQRVPVKPEPSEASPVTPSPAMVEVKASLEGENRALRRQVRDLTRALAALRRK